jgi:excisionase family DNA binding protein
MATKVPGSDRLAYSRDEMAQVLGVSRESVVRAIAKGKIKIVRFGRRVLIPATELQRLLRGE